MRLLRLDALDFFPGDTPPDRALKGAAQIVLQGGTLVFPLEGMMDFGAERERLQKTLSKTKAEINGLKQKVNLPDFMEKAPPHVLADVLKRLEDAENLEKKLLQAWDFLSTVSPDLLEQKR
jgi:valyl-tRNA synthetase